MSILHRAFWLPLWVLSGAAVVAALVIARPQPVHAGGDRPPPLVAVRPFEARPATPVVRAWGRVEPVDRVQRRAEVGGRVRWRHPDLQAGRVLPAGTEVLRLDEADLRAALAGREAERAALAAGLAELDAALGADESQLSLARERLAIARDELARTEQLHRRQLAPDSALGRERAAVIAVRQEIAAIEARISTAPPRRARLRAETEALDAAIATARRQLERARLRLDRQALITDVSVEAGDWLAAGTPVFGSAASGRFELLARLAPADLALVDESEPAEIEFDGDRAPRTARWHRLDPVTDAGTGALGLRLRFEAPAGETLIGRLGRVELRGAARAAVRLPEAALQPAGLLWWVDGDSHLQSSPAKRLWREPGSVLLDPGALPAGAAVLVGPPPDGASPGDPVRAVDAPA